MTIPQQNLLDIRATLPTLDGHPVGTISLLAKAAGRTKSSVYVAIHNGTLSTHDLPGFGKCLRVDDLIAYLGTAHRGRPRKTPKKIESHVSQPTA